jgi:uncharacterized protein YxjI
LFEISNKLLSIKTTYEAEDANGNHVFTVKKKFGSKWSLPQPEYWC